MPRFRIAKTPTVKKIKVKLTLSKSLYPSDEGVRSRWELIERALSRPLLCVDDLEEAILSYNSRFQKSWSFRLLKAYFTRYASLEVKF